MKNYEDILGKFPHRGCLDFTINSKLRQLSKEIPEGLCGIYMYVLCNTDKEDILYIGCSGHIEKGEPVSKKKHGLRGRIYGKQEKTPRDKFYKEVMKEKGVTSLKIYWFDTVSEDPEYIEYLCILRFITLNGRFPEFNKKLEVKENRAKETVFI